MSDTLSIIAIVISVITLLFEFYRDVKLNKTNLKSEYFKELYFKLLLEEIPQERNNLFFNPQGYLIHYRNFVELFNLILEKSMYYKYTDSKYYTELKNSVQELEDYVLETANKSFNKKLHSGILDDIDEKVENIFSILTNKYEKG